MTSTVQEAPVTGPPRPAPARLTRGPAGVAGPLLAVALVAVGLLLLRDALVAAGALGGRTAVSVVLEAVDGLTPETWLIPLGAVAAVAGLALIVAALRPRSSRDLLVTAATTVALTRSDVARLASDAAEEVGGVLRARVSAGRRRVTATVETITADAAVTEEIRRTITARLAPLRQPPAVRTRIRAPRPDKRRTV